MSQGRGLTAGDFERVASRGFGDPLNAYTHSMAWFGDRLIVGTTRANLVLLRAHGPEHLTPWPVRVPKDIYELDLRAGIYQLDPTQRRVRELHRSPLVSGREGDIVPRDLGYRAMAVLNGGTTEKTLYVSCWPGSRAARGAILLRSTDGEHFQPASQLPNSQFNTYRALLAHSGRLYSAPTGRIGGHPNEAENAVVLESSEPPGDEWQPVCPPGLGDASNSTVFELAGVDGRLYAGTLNPLHGFEVWSTVDESRRRWTRVCVDGAYRGNLNQAAVCMQPFGGSLYIGTGVQNGGYDRKNRVGPVAAEVVRLNQDGSFDVIVGESRRTPQGQKVPLSGMGPGFDDPFNGYMWRMAVHDGWLYVGTYNWATFLPYLSLEAVPPALQHMVRRIGRENLARTRGGFDLWRTRDGTDWQPVTCDGFGSRWNIGARSLVSTPHGLFVGTANPFGPEVAVRVGGSWTYKENPRGGLEIWRGSD